jgi:hypothetical protein
MRIPPPATKERFQEPALSDATMRLRTTSVDPGLPRESAHALQGWTLVLFQLACRRANGGCWATMTRRGQLTDVAAGLVGSFVSRNNDIGGYWALGLLRSLSDRVGVTLLRLDLRTASAEPADPTALDVARSYSAELQRHLGRRRIPNNVVIKAEINVQFLLSAQSLRSASTYGQPVRCTVLLVDRQKRVHQRSLLTNCAPHNPARERRSNRAGK